MTDEKNPYAEFWRQVTAEVAGHERRALRVGPEPCAHCVKFREELEKGLREAKDQVQMPYLVSAFIVLEALKRAGL